MEKFNKINGFVYVYTAEISWYGVQFHKLYSINAAAVIDDVS